MAVGLTGRLGKLYTSEYVYDEAVTLTRSRTGHFEDAKQIGDRILGRGEHPETATLLAVSSSHFERSIETFERYSDHSLSFTNATTIALIDHHDIDAVLSFDDFDGIVDRLDPADVDER